MGFTRQTFYFSIDFVWRLPEDYFLKLPKELSQSLVVYFHWGDIKACNFNYVYAAKGVL